MSSIHLDIQVIPEDKIVLQTEALGLRPYVNVSADADADENVTFKIRAGGGAITTDADDVTKELGEFFEMLAGLVREGTVTVEESADEDDEPEDDEDEDA